MPKVDEKLLIYQKMTNLIYYSKNLLNKYPKCERFDLCSDIKNNLYRTLKNVIFAWKAYENKEKLEYLREIDVDLLVLKSLITISYKYQHISQKNYMVWNEHVGEIGKLVGSWMKTCQRG
ncbi:MAG: diversity-generating retroelement protein Avd [Clostridia bacterium]|nr:diversity-generating retroelement protein Avd [Clostridia bacterium]